MRADAKDCNQQEARNGFQWNAAAFPRLDFRHIDGGNGFVLLKFRVRVSRLFFRRSNARLAISTNSRKIRTGSKLYRSPTIGAVDDLRRHCHRSYQFLSRETINALKTRMLKFRYH